MILLVSWLRVMKVRNTMTRQEKIAWLANASNEEVVNQLRWAVTAMTNGSQAFQIEGQENFELAQAEILRRMK